MTTTDFERKLNLLVRAIETGEVNEQQAKARYEMVLTYAIFDRERTMAKEKFDLVMRTRFGTVEKNKAST